MHVLHAFSSHEGHVMHARSFATVSSEPHITQSVIFVVFGSVMEKVKLYQIIVAHKLELSFETILIYRAPARLVVKHPMMTRTMKPRHVDRGFEI